MNKFQVNGTLKVRFSTEITANNREEAKAIVGAYGYNDFDTKEISYEEVEHETLMVGGDWKEIKFYVRGKANYIYVPEIQSESDEVYEVKFDVGIKETIKCAGTYDWKMIHQETNKIVTVDTKTIFEDVSSFYQYTIVTKNGPKIYSVKKL